MRFGFGFGLGLGSGFGLGFGLGLGLGKGFRISLRDLAVSAMKAGSRDPMSLSIARFTAPEVVSGPGEG